MSDRDCHDRGQLLKTINSTCGLVAMTSASHAEGRQFDPGQVYSHGLPCLCKWKIHYNLSQSTILHVHTFIYRERSIHIYLCRYVCTYIFPHTFTHSCTSHHHCLHHFKEWHSCVGLYPHDQTYLSVGRGPYYVPLIVLTIHNLNYCVCFRYSHYWPVGSFRVPTVVHASACVV